MNFVLKIYKNAYGGLSPATWWLSLVMLINRSGTMVVPFLTLYLTQALHFPIAQSGLVMAIYGCGAVCGAFIGGKLTDIFGFFYVQLGALMSGGIMFIVLGQMHNYPLICITTFFLAMLNESFRPANTSAIAEYSHEQNRTRSFSLNRLSVNLGWALGSAIGGFVAGHNYELLFWIDGITNIGAAVMLFLVLSPKKSSQTPTRKKQTVQSSVSNSVYSDGLYLAFIFLTVMFSISFFQLFTTVPIFFKVALKLEPEVIGAIMAMNGLLIAFIEMILIFKLESLNKNLQFIVYGIALVGLSFIIFNFMPAGVAVAVVSTLIVTVGEMLAMPFMNTFMISRTNAVNRGQYAGLYTASWSVAQVVGPYTGTLIIASFGFSTLWWVIGAMCILTALGFQWMSTQIKHN